MLSGSVEFNYQVMFRLATAKVFSGAAAVGLGVSTISNTSNNDLNANSDFTRQQIIQFKEIVGTITPEDVELVSRSIDRDVIRTAAKSGHPLLDSSIDNIDDEMLENIRDKVSLSVQKMLSISNESSLYSDTFKKLKSKIVHNSRKYSNVEACWDGLTSRFKCGICIDVLAAPVILSCSHNFCGDCLYKHLRHSEVLTDEISSLCPECRTEFIPSQIIFERALDELIQSEVESFKLSSSHSESVREWEIRRTNYLNRQKRTNNSIKTNNGLRDHENDNLIQCVASLLVAVVIGMLIYLKQNKST